MSLLNWPFGAATSWILILLVLGLIWGQAVILERGWRPTASR